MTRGLVLSIFPGIDLLGRAFEEEGYCIVRGPDVLWGGDVRRFHPPAWVFEGVIGGPPCKMFTRLRFLNPKCGQKQGNLIPEYERVVGEAQPAWFLMENVQDAPEPAVQGYTIHSQLLNNRWVPDGDGRHGAEQNRERRFSFGTHDGRRLAVDVAIFEAPLREYAVTSSASRVPVADKRDGHGGHRRKKVLAPPAVTGSTPGLHSREARGQTNITWAEACRLQGLPDTFLEDAPFTVDGKREVLGNGVPLPMGRAIARAVKRAMEPTP